MRKGLAVILALSLLLALIGPTPKAEAAAQTEREAYIQRMIAEYLGAANITGDTITYTDEMCMLDAEDETVTLTFVLVDSCLAGCLSVYCSNGQFHSTFGVIDSDRLRGVFRRYDPFFLKYSENDILLISETEVIALYGRQTERYNGPMANREDNSYSMHVLYGTDNSRPLRMSGTVNVPTVTTGNSLLTWAACVASVVNYYNSSYFDAVGVHNTLVYYYGATPYCSDLWIGRGYSYLGGFGCSHASTTYFETLQEEICVYHRPVLFQFSDESVIVCKYFSENQNGTFVLGYMDPYGSGNIPTTFSEYTFPSGLTYPSLYGGNNPPQTLARVHYKE